MDNFRPLRRSKRAITDQAAKLLLTNEKRGVLAVNGDNGYPFAFPINFFYDSERDKIYFHGAKTGHKVDSLKKSDKVCFTVYGNEFMKDDWAPYVQSVVVYGRCQMVDDLEEKTERIREIARRYYPNEEEIEAEISRDIAAAGLYVINIEHICGKQIHEK